MEEAQGMPPRTTPADYQAHAQAGAVTVAAEFLGHSFPTPEETLSNEDYVVVEAGLFGAPGSRLKLSYEDFSLRINDKKNPLPGQPYALVFKSLKDPELEPPSKSAESKTSINGGGGNDNSPPPPVHLPIKVVVAMQQRVEKASMPEGERALPKAGLLFFQYRGKTDHIRSIELIYNGPAGKTSMALQP